MVTGVTAAPNHTRRTSRSNSFQAAWSSQHLEAFLLFFPALLLGLCGLPFFSNSLLNNLVLAAFSESILFQHTLAAAAFPLVALFLVALYAMNSPIPQISISLAPPEEIPEEPRSPFSPSSWAVLLESDENFRPQHLSPMSAGSPSFPKVLSPLRPDDAPVKGAGLERQRFEALLKASRERSSATGARKAADLRKEIALKAHKSKHGKLAPLRRSNLHTDSGVHSSRPPSVVLV